MRPAAAAAAAAAAAGGNGLRSARRNAHARRNGTAEGRAVCEHNRVANR